MIIWSGWGFLVAVMVFAASLLAELSVESSFHDDAYYQSHAWPLTMALICAAIAIWYVGSYLNRQPDAVNRHRFFFMPMQYWAPILGVVAIVTLAFR